MNNPRSTYLNIWINKTSYSHIKKKKKKSYSNHGNQNLKIKKIKNKKNHAKD